MTYLDKIKMEFYKEKGCPGPIVAMRDDDVFDFMYSKMIEREDKLKAKLLTKIEPLRHRNEKGNTNYYIGRLETLEECLKMIEESEVE